MKNISAVTNPVFSVANLPVPENNVDEADAFQLENVAQRSLDNDKALNKFIEKLQKRYQMSWNAISDSTSGQILIPGNGDALFLTHFPYVVPNGKQLILESAVWYLPPVNCELIVGSQSNIYWESDVRSGIANPEIVIPQPISGVVSTGVKNNEPNPININNNGIHFTITFRIEDVSLALL